MKSVFKNDRYKKNRGGYSRLLEIHCAACESVLCHYQKDGPGILKRIYIDRMLTTENKPSTISSKTLTCSNCSETLGTKIIYKKENRPAYRLFVGAIGKKIIKST